MVTEATPQVYPEWVLTESERKLHDDFRYFMWRIWRHLELPNPTRRQLAIARYLQFCDNPRRMVQAFRGLGKTWITCTYALWRLYRDPQERVKIVSANEGKATENAVFMRRLIDEVPELLFLRPSGSQRDSVLAFDVGPSRASVTPSVSCLGINGQLTGGRATILVADDVEVPKNSFTETMREKLAELIKEFDALVVPEGFDIIYLGTPQTEQSIYKLVVARGYDCRIWPARYPTMEQLMKYGDAIADDIVEDLVSNPKLAGTTTEIERFSDADLLARELSYGKSGFALQFMLDTSLSDALKYPLKLADLLVMDVAPDMGPVRVEWTSDSRNEITDLGNPGFAGDRFYRPLTVSTDRAPWQGCVMVIDPSGRGTDETSYAIVRALYGTLYLVASGGFRDGYGDATLQALAQLAKLHHATMTLVESNMGDGMFTKLYAPHLAATHPCAIEEYKVTGQKEVRIIDDLEPIMNQHRLVIDAAVVRADLASAETSGGTNYSLFYQLTHLTKERGALAHEDRLEALSRACRYFYEQLAHDTAKAEAAHREKLRDAEYAAFMVRAKRPAPRKTIHGLPPGITLSSPRGVLGR